MKRITNGISKKVLTGALAFTIIATSSVSAAGTYKVEYGDTYWKISEKFNVDIEELMDVNKASGSSTLFVGEELIIPNDYTLYTVKSGDTPWIISEKFGVSLEELLPLNNLSTSSYIYVGQTMKIPSSKYYYTVISGDTPWIISEKLGVSLESLLSINNLDEKSYIYTGQRLIIPREEKATTNSIPSQPKVSIDYKYHTVVSGDNFWNISLKYGLTYTELLKVNNATEDTVLNIGDSVKIPVYTVGAMTTLGEEYGEYLDWYKGTQYLIPIGSEFKVIDFYTGKSFRAKRTTGANHADVETLTALDTLKMKEIFGGEFSWEKRPVIIEYNNRRIAASVAGMPHAGNDKTPGGEYTSWRSDGYGDGINFDYVKGNNMDGVFDIHFYNSTRHKDGLIDENHQENIKISAGIIK